MLICLALLWAATLPDAQLYQQTLTRHVQADGRVRYAALHNDLAPLTKYVEQLAAVSPDSHPALFPSADAQKAYWVNAYNALVLWSFAQEYPSGKDRLSSKLGQYRYFFRRKFTVGGRGRSLDDIEVHSLREKFNDPRIHFAIVCASASCPALSREVYTPERMNEQLEREARKYLHDDRQVRLDAAQRTVTVSEIFKWFQKDWGGSENAVLRWVARYRPEAKLDNGSWKLAYYPYDWRINDAARQP